MAKSTAARNFGRLFQRIVKLLKLQPQNKGVYYSTRPMLLRFIPVPDIQRCIHCEHTAPNIRTTQAPAGHGHAVFHIGTRHISGQCGGGSSCTHLVHFGNSRHHTTHSSTARLYRGPDNGNAHSYHQCTWDRRMRLPGYGLACQMFRPSILPAQATIALPGIVIGVIPATILSSVAILITRTPVDAPDTIAAAKLAAGQLDPFDLLFVLLDFFHDDYSFTMIISSGMIITSPSSRFARWPVIPIPGTITGKYSSETESGIASMILRMYSLSATDRPVCG